MTGTSVAALLQAGRAFLTTRWRAEHLRTRARVARHRSARLRHFLAEVAPRVEAFRPLRGAPLEAFPVMDKAGLMAAFERYNRFGITSDQAWDAYQGGTLIAGCTVGASTGTSGNRGLYVVSDAERFTWLGVMLAKALPEVWRTAHRVAVLLPTNSRLYDAANESGRLALKFFDLREGIVAQAAAVAAFRPTVIIAPPKALVILADTDVPLAPAHVFSGAEVLDPIDRTRIEARFSTVVREIYMATEGLFAVACEQGTLHLAEDVVAFEWEPGPPGSGLVAPLVTDFSRRTQMMIRYRMNDLLRLDDRPCPCGSALQPVREVVGRADDVFELRGGNGTTVAVTPDVIRNAVVGADRTITDFRVIQTAEDRVEVVLCPGQADRLAAATAALAACFGRLGASPSISGRTEALTPPTDRKLRRVVRMPQPRGRDHDRASSDRSDASAAAGLVPGGALE